MNEHSDPAELPPLKIFIDRSIQGHRLINAARSLVDDVETINERYGLKAAELTEDQQWIAEATADGRILLGADLRIRRTRSNDRPSAATRRAMSSSATTTCHRAS